MSTAWPGFGGSSSWTLRFRANSKKSHLLSPVFLGQKLKQLRRTKSDRSGLHSGPHLLHQDQATLTQPSEPVSLQVWCQKSVTHSSLANWKTSDCLLIPKGVLQAVHTTDHGRHLGDHRTPCARGAPENGYIWLRVIWDRFRRYL